MKRFDPLVSKGSVFRIMGILVDCGLANSVAPDRNRQAARYTRAGVSPAHRDGCADPTCAHLHLVCKDCGAEVGVA